MRRIFLSLVLLFAPAACFGATYTFAGAVYNNSSLLIDGATVALYPWNGTSPTQTTTTFFGNYSLSPIPAGEYSVVISKSGMVTTASSVWINGNSSTNNYFIDTTEQEVFQTIEVVDQYKNVIVGATIDLFQGTAFYAAATTDLNGQATISGLEFGKTYNVCARKDGYQPSNASFSSTYTTYPTNSITITLEANPASMSGYVKDEQVVPVAIEDVLVTYYVNNTYFSVNTDSSGFYSFTNLQAGSSNITFTKNQYIVISISEELTGGEVLTDQNVELELSNAYVSGTVLDFDTQLPLQGAIVSLQQVNNAVLWFTTGVDGQFIFGSVCPGQNTLKASKTSYQAESASIALNDGGVGSVSFTLYPSSITINGSVTALGIPIQGTYSVYQDAVPLTSSSPFQNGTFSFNELGGGTYTISVDAPLYQTSSQTITVSAGSEVGLEFDLLPAPASLTGLVRDSSLDSIVGAKLTAYQDSNPIGVAYTDSTGSYLFSNLPAGSVKVRVRATGYKSAQNTQTYAAGDSRTHNFKLTSNPNTLNVEIYDLLTTYPLPAALITLNEDSNLFNSGYGTNLGTYSFTGLDEETYTYSAQLSGYVSNQSEPFTFSGSGETIVSRLGLYPEDAPPINIEGNIIPNYYGAGVIDVIHNIVWEASLSPEVVSYNVYGNGVLLGNVLSSETLEFNHHNQNKNEGTTYTVESVNSNGSVSSSVEVILR